MKGNEDIKAMPTMIPGGYMAKRVAARLDWINAEPVAMIRLGPVTASSLLFHS